MPAPGSSSEAVALLLRRRRGYVPAAPSLMAAVKAAYDGLALSAPAYLDAASKRVALKAASGPTAARGYVVVEVVSSPLAFTSSTSKLRNYTLRFRCYGTSAVESRTLADAVEDGLKGRTLRFAGGGYSGPLVIGNRGPKKDPGLSAGGNEVWYESVEFSTKVNRG